MNTDDATVSLIEMIQEKKNKILQECADLESIIKYTTIVEELKHRPRWHNITYCYCMERGTMEHFDRTRYITVYDFKENNIVDLSTLSEKYETVVVSQGVDDYEKNAECSVINVPKTVRCIKVSDIVPNLIQIPEDIDTLEINSNMVKMVPPATKNVILTDIYSLGQSFSDDEFDRVYKKLTENINFFPQSVERICVKIKNHHIEDPRILC